MKYLEALALSILAVFAPIKAVMLVTLVLIIADTITGILAARKRGEPITSTGFKRTVGKLLLYESALCLAFLVEQYITGPAIPVSKLVSSMIGLTELKSILENCDDISGKSIFQAVVDRITQSGAK